MKAQRKVSPAEKTLHTEIRALRKLPKTPELKTQIAEKKQQLSSIGNLARGSGQIATYNYESFEGKLQDGSKVVMVFEKEEGNIYWNAYLFTFLTDAQAKTLFDFDGTTEFIQAYNCGLEFAEWDSNDSGGNFLDSIATELGIEGAKGTFEAGHRIYYTDPVDMLRGQSVFIVKVDDEGAEIGVVGSASFGISSSSSSSSSAWFFVSLALLIFILFMRYRNKQFFF